MAGRRGGRRKVTIRVGPVSGSYEWIGFRDGGVTSNLNTNVAFELIPPNVDDTVGVDVFTALRVVGEIAFSAQSSVITATRVGIVLLASDVGADQTVDELVDPLSTDVDDFANKDIMWWWTGKGVAQTVAADFDQVPLQIPIDIRVKRLIGKRTRLFFNVTANPTAAARVTCNVRCLLRHR